MMQHTPVPSDLDHGPVIIRALSSLSSPHVEAVIALAGDTWSVETINDYDGYLTIILEPNHEPGNRPSYLICGTVQQIELTEMHGEELTTILRSSDLAVITTELSKRLQG